MANKKFNFQSLITLLRSNLEVLFEEWQHTHLKQTVGSAPTLPATFILTVTDSVKRSRSETFIVNELLDNTHTRVC